MDVIVKYPAAFPLVGYDLALFDWSLRKLLRRDFYSHTLSRLARKSGVDLESPESIALLAELGELEFDEIDKLPAALRIALPEKVGALLGVSIEPYRRAHSLRRWAVGVGAVAVTSVAIAAAILLPKLVHREPVQSYAQLSPATLPRPVFVSPAASAFQPQFQSSDSSSRSDDFILDSTVVSRTPSVQASQAVAMAALAPGAEYRVHVTVERVGDVSSEDR